MSKPKMFFQLSDFIKKSKNPLIVVLGPTASGKTALSIKIAGDFNGEIISLDSRQIYRGMEIGTDAIPPQEQKGVPHYMLGIRTPDKTLTLAEFVDIALRHTDEIHQRNKVPLLVGGTGLYISAITEGYKLARIPPDQKLRDQLKKEAMEKGGEHLHGKLRKIDPISAAKIHPNNLPYVIRAIEVALAKGKKEDLKEKSRFDTFMIGVNWPREKLYERINLRVEKQLERGLVNEVQNLLDRGFSQDLPAMSSLGVKEIIPYLQGKMSLEECVEILKKRTRNYAKRQMTWFRRYDNVHWITPEQLEEILNQNL